MSLKRDLLSDEFKVAVVVYELTEIDDKTAYFSSIREKLRNIVTAENICRCLTFLQSWGIVKMNYSSSNDDCGTGHDVYRVSFEDYDTIQMLYEKYWAES